MLGSPQLSSERSSPPAGSIARVYAGAADLNLNAVDQNVFPPDDPWTLTLAEALVKKASQGALDGQNILELGIGSGVNMLGLKALAMNGFFEREPSFIGLDITMESVRACDELARAHNFRQYIDLHTSNLLEVVDHLDGEERDRFEQVDMVFACLPQVCWDYEQMGREPRAREFADYYVVPKDEIPEDAYALGLLARALDQVHNKIPQASVLFNVAGRQGRKSFDLFRDHGFPVVDPVVHRIIPHDVETDLSSFVKWEKMSGEHCLFYRDPSGKEPIDASEAEDRRGNAPVFHDLYTVEASPA